MVSFFKFYLTDQQNKDFESLINLQKRYSTNGIKILISSLKGHILYPLKSMSSDILFTEFRLDHLT